MDDKPAKKKKAKKSWTSQIKRFKERIEESHQWGQRGWNEVRRLRLIVEVLERIYQKKYFKIEYKIQSNSKNVINYNEIIHSFCLELAIEKIKLNKTYPDTFQLIDVKILG